MCWPLQTEVKSRVSVSYLNCKGIYCAESTYSSSNHYSVSFSYFHSTGSCKAMLQLKYFLSVLSFKITYWVITVHLYYISLNPTSFHKTPDAVVFTRPVPRFYHTSGVWINCSEWYPVIWICIHLANSKYHSVLQRPFNLFYFPPGDMDISATCY